MISIITKADNSFELIVLAYLMVFGSCVKSYCRFSELGSLIWEDIARNEVEGVKSADKICGLFKDLGKKYAFLYSFIAFISWTSIVVCFYLNECKDYFPVVITTLIMAGIHIPIILALGSYIIRFTQRTIFKKHIIEDKDMEYAIIITVLSLNMAMFLINIDIALFIAAVILGRWLWLDCIYHLEETKKQIDDIKECFMFRSGKPTKLYVLFGQYIFRNVILYTVIVIVIAIVCMRK